jgi:hypothetical protein
MSEKIVILVDSLLTAEECADFIIKMDVSGSLNHTDRGNAVYE